MRQTILLVTLLLIVVMCLFPPFTATRVNPDAGVPEVTETEVTKYRFFTKKSTWETEEHRYDGSLDARRLGIQLIIVLALGAGAYVVLDE